MQEFPACEVKLCVPIVKELVCLKRSGNGSQCGAATVQGLKGKKQLCLIGWLVTKSSTKQQQQQKQARMSLCHYFEGEQSACFHVS